MSLYEKIVSKKEKIAVIGLGYVGMPVAIAFAKKAEVIGFDTNEQKLLQYQNGIDPNMQFTESELLNSSIEYTSDETRLREAKFIVVAVPTPVNMDHTPDLSPVIGASEIVGRNLCKGAIVVYESTVFPGCTEDICVPVLEKMSNLCCGRDFKVGYSPERINPGDKVNRLETIRKIVSGIDEEALNEIQQIYNLIIEVGTYSVSNIKTAEAIKVVENSQRDVNIAFMNELAMVFDRMGIDTNEVIDGMNTKWNALGFRPGLVGGHCIGVDPYYFTYEAEKLGYHSQIILNGRIINDSIGSYVADTTIRYLVKVGKAPQKSKIVIMGLTFKENCPDIRNSRVYDIIKQLKLYGVLPIIIDPWANEEEAEREYDIQLSTMNEVMDSDCIIMAVAHDCFKKISIDELETYYSKGPAEEKVLIDVKGLYSVKELKRKGITYWRL